MDVNTFLTGKKLKVPRASHLTHIFSYQTDREVGERLRESKENLFFDIMSTNKIEDVRDVITTPWPQAAVITLILGAHSASIP